MGPLLSPYPQNWRPDPRHRRVGTRIRWRWDRRRQHADQAASTADQTTADKDQTASDTDQSASDRDQVQADADQRASERDQAASDRDFASRPTGDAEMVRTHELSRTERVQGTLDRHAATLVRSQVSSERDEQAKERDEVAQQRDRVAEERDRVAEEHDREIKHAGEDLGRDDPRAARALAALAEMRDKAAAHACRPRRIARGPPETVRPRRLIASTCSQSWSVRIWTISPAPTGAAWGRSRSSTRSSAHGARIRLWCSPISTADRLKDVNDREGHAAGDALLRDLVALLRSKLRPYDPVVRWGGDEFVCTISDADLETARSRFEEIRQALAEKGERR